MIMKHSKPLIKIYMIKFKFSINNIIKQIIK